MHLALLPLLAACANDPRAPCPAADAPPSVVLGVGERDLTPVADGDTVSYSQGPQGGWHVWGSI